MAQPAAGRRPEPKMSLNTDLIDELRLLLGEDFSELVGTFQRDVAALTTQLKMLVDAKQAEHARRVAHSLKGSASNMGAVRLAACWSQVESLSQESSVSYSQLEAEIDAALREYEVVNVLLNGYLDRSKG